MILPNGSENPEVASLLRAKRVQHLKDYPEEEIASGAARGVIAYNGEFIALDKWNQMSPGQKFAVTVGSTCTHYNGDVPGFGRYD